MTIRKCRVFIFCALLLLAVTAGAQSKKAHPYLYFTPDHVQHLKERLKTDTLVARVWNDMKAKADQAVAAGRGGNMDALCLAYRMTGDTKYAQQAKGLLLQLVNKEAWDGMDDRTPRWNSGLATGRGCFTSALAFDCIYDYLSKQERKYIADKIVKLGIEPSIGDWISDDKRIHSLNSMGHNWWSAVVHEAGVASLAVMNEVPQAKDWAEEVLRSSTEWFGFSGSVLENKPATFDHDGGFYESVGYANFGVSEYLLFRLAWTNAFTAIKMPYDELLKKTMDWWIHACYPTDGRMMSLNFGDSNPFANADRPVKLMIALGLGREGYDWYLNETKKGIFNEDLNINTAMGLVYQPDKITTLKTPGLPPSAIYKDIGWAMLRSSWNKNATMLGVKSGFTWNHSHADAGSFVLYHRGKNLLIDAGDIGYGLDEYSNYFVRSEAHNVMLFNGKAQEPQDQYNAVKNMGHLYDMIDGGSMKYVLADATGPTSHYFLRNYRSFLWVGNVILVI
ncbi:MAG TPA: heparinase II/III family protein, partial [Chitinophagaceae bacterium]|nr:heparinase II/III family protein [Chitinophagaceae bacterium]